MSFLRTLCLLLLCLCSTSWALPKALEKAEEAILEDHYEQALKILTDEYGEEPSNGYAAVLRLLASQPDSPSVFYESAKELVNKFPDEGSAHILYATAAAAMGKRDAIKMARRSLELGFPSEYPARMAADFFKVSSQTEAKLKSYEQWWKNHSGKSAFLILTEIATLTHDLSRSHAPHESEAQALTAKYLKACVKLPALAKNELQFLTAADVLADTKYHDDVVAVLDSRKDWRFPVFVAEIYFHAKDPEDAVVYARKARTEAKNEVQKIKASYWEGLSLLEIDHLDEAKPLLLEVAASKSSRWDKAVVVLAKGEIRKERYAEAEEVCSAALKRDPNQWRARFQLARALAAQNRKDEAKTHLEKLKNFRSIQRAAEQDVLLKGLID